MYRFLRLGIGFLLAVGITVNASAATPDGQTPETAFPLPASLTASVTIVGNGGGAYTFYTFDAPANGTGTVTLTLNPQDPVTSSDVGVNLYQAGTTLAGINGVNSAGTLGTNSATFTTTAGPVLVQAYNYRQGLPATVSFAIAGLTPAGSAPPTPAPAPAAPPPTGSGQTSETAVAFPSSLTVSGTIMGNGGGAYAFYTFNSPANATGTLTLTINPPDPITSSAVGVNLYQSGTTLLGLNGVNPNGTLGNNSSAFTTTAGGPVLVQVYNYRQGQAVSYNIAVTGTGITP